MREGKPAQAFPWGASYPRPAGPSPLNKAYQSCRGHSPADSIFCDHKQRNSCTRCARRGVGRKRPQRDYRCETWWRPLGARSPASARAVAKRHAAHHQSRRHKQLHKNLFMDDCFPRWQLHAGLLGRRPNRLTNFIALSNANCSEYHGTGASGHSRRVQLCWSLLFRAA